MAPNETGRPLGGESTDLVMLSAAEVAFLRKVTQLINGHSGPLATEALRTIREKLEQLNRDDARSSDRFLLVVTGGELSRLHDATKSAYSFITAEERRARLVLREKLHVSSRKLGLPADGPG
jgi:hypothetical protein